MYFSFNFVNYFSELKRIPGKQQQYSGLTDSLVSGKNSEQRKLRMASDIR